MDSADRQGSASYELPIQGGSRGVVGVQEVSGGRETSLPESLLIRNVLWFCRLRWFIIGILMAFGIVGMFEEVIRHIGLHPPGNWPLLAGGALTLSNAAFLIHARLLSRRVSANATMINLWGQIITDLLVLTAVVHFLGSVRTYVLFTYLFHHCAGVYFLLAGAEPAGNPHCRCALRRLHRRGASADRSAGQRLCGSIVFAPGRHDSNNYSFFRVTLRATLQSCARRTVSWRAQPQSRPGVTSRSNVARASCP